MEEFIQHVLNGLALGSIYALIALGYTMVYGILGLINFAHGDVFMVGAFVGYYMARGLGIDRSPSFLYSSLILGATMVICAILGFVIERVAYRPLRNAPRINALITAIGVSLFLEYAGQIAFGADPKFFPTIIENEVLATVGRVDVSSLQLLVMGVALFLMLSLRNLIQHTKVGMAMRAISTDYQTARLLGIPTERVVSVTFMWGAALAAAAGILVGLSYPRIDPLMGVMPGLKAFVAAVLGGIGSFPGAVVGAMVIGFSEEMVVGYWKSTYRDALVFGILILILLVRPSGLIGRHLPEKV